jgi:phenylacetate-CoA ligase
MDARMNSEPTDDDRYPTLTPAGRRMLRQMLEHPAAPIFRNESGNRLMASEVAELRAFESETLAAAVDWRVGEPPHWVSAFVQRVFGDVPHYRALGSPPLHFEDLPTISRGDLAADIARFVPDSIPTERLINFRTTGTTGQPLLVASHPVVAARYLPFHKRALRRFGVMLTHGHGQVGVILLGHQRKCFTYVSVTPSMNESGLAKINLHPDDWRHPDDRARYIDAMAPEVLAGDPISFAELLRLPVAVRPKALVSVSMSLSPGLRCTLEERFACPVLDVYSLNEVGPVGVFDAAAGGHVLLQPNLYVETLDRDGHPVAAGQRGEIAVTGGFNFCLPLLRYRTGDHGVLFQGLDGPVIFALSGRAPVRFRSGDGTWFNNIDVSHALASIPLSRFGMHQNLNGGFVLRLAPEEMRWSEAASAALASLIAGAALSLEAIAQPDKFVQYTSDLEAALA